MKVEMTDHEHDEEPLAPQFSMNEFRRWMNENGSSRFAMNGRRKSEGAEVEPRVTMRKFVGKMEAEEGDLVEMARDFRDNGGVVVESNGDCFLVKVECGLFRIARSCVKRKD